MKIMFVSDIHGSIKYLNRVIQSFEEEKADKLVLLGDFLEGSSNIPDYFYNPLEVAELLNQYKYKIIAVRGNCDSDADQRKFEFPMLDNFVEFNYHDRKIFATHGHQYHKNNMPNLNKGDIFIQGHLHVPDAIKFQGIYYLNPGSISLPRQNSRNSYGILEGERFLIKDLEGNILKEIEII